MKYLVNEREQQMLEALRKIEAHLVWSDRTTKDEFVLRIMNARAIARDAIIDATQSQT